jgi:hypothetical protein
VREVVLRVLPLLCVTERLSAVSQITTISICALFNLLSSRTLGLFRHGLFRGRLGGLSWLYPSKLRGLYGLSRNGHSRWRLGD